MQSSMREVVLRVATGARPAQLPLRLLAVAPDAAIATTVAHLDDGGLVWRILEATGDASSLDRVQSAFTSDRAPAAEKAVLVRSPRRLVLWFKYKPPQRSLTALALRLLGRDTVVTDTARRGRLDVRVLARDQPGLERFVRQATARGATLAYAGPVRPEAGDALTEAEEAALRAARAAGYYDVPRRSGIRAVARALRVPPTTASYRLRRAEAKLVHAKLG